MFYSHLINSVLNPSNGVQYCVHRKVELMKINISIEATPEEVREAIGLPNITEIQSILMSKITEKVKDGSMDAGSVMELVNPKMNLWGKLLMDAAMKNLEMMTMAGKKNESNEKPGPGQAA